MRRYPTILIFLIALAISPSCYSQKDSVKVNNSERKVIIDPNPVKDSAWISIAGNYDLKTLKISIVSHNGLAVHEFIPRKIPYKLQKGKLAPGRYYVRCIDKFGRIPSKKMTIKGNAIEEDE